MPTRVVLRDEANESAYRRRRTINDADEFDTRPSLVTPPSRIGGTSPNRPSVQRSISVNFRTALRDDDDDDSVNQNNEMSTDIRGSPRLMGYLSCGLASSVMLVSVIQFYRKGDDNVGILVFRRQLDEMIPGDNATDADTGEEPTEAVFGSTVLENKLIAAIAVASAGVFFNLVILLMYMDTFCCPLVWRKVFCDGSVHERNLLFAFILFEIFSLYVCTSSFSVGEVQANVYFTAWICFFSIVMNYRSWRIGAGKKTIQDLLVEGRETAQNWIGTLLCSLVAAISVSDLYVYRDNLTFVINGEEQTIQNYEWVQVLSVIWSCVGACVLMIVMIFCWKEPKYPCGPSRCRWDGRFIEGAVLLVMIGLWFWGLLEYTEVDGAIGHPSNAYFSIWGSFFFSIMTFGTWIKENRNLVTKATGIGSESPTFRERASATSGFGPSASRVSMGSDRFQTARG